MRERTRLESAIRDTQAVEQGLDPRRTVAVDTVFPLDVRRTLMSNPLTD